MEKDPSINYGGEEFNDSLIIEVIKIRVKERLRWIETHFPKRWERLVGHFATNNFTELVDLICSEENYEKAAEVSDIPVDVLFYKGVDDKDRFIEKVGD